MIYRIPWALLLGFVMAWPLVAADDPKKEGTSEKEETEAKPPPVKGKWTPVGALLGQVKVASPNSLTLIVEYQEMQPKTPNAKGNNNANNAANRQMQNFQNQMNSANRIKNPAQRAARVQQIQAQMQVAAMKQANNFKMVTKKKDVDVVMANELQVRVQDPPQEFDEKGKAKKFTAEELKKLKGPGNLWGYPGEIDKIKPGAILQVFLYKKAKKTVARAAPKGSLLPKKEEGDDDKDKDKDKAKEKAKDEDEKPTSKSKETAPAAEDDDDGTDPVVKVVYVRKESTLPDGKSPKGK
jgi:hypothetical protein